MSTLDRRPLRLAIIIGSTREGRFGPVVANWVAEEASNRTELDVDLVDLADVPLPAHYPQGTPPGCSDFLRRLDDADAFVVVTPEYNHSFPASLKQAIDLAGSEWHRKPVALVSYGGLAGGLRAVEQLRLVFAEMHAVTIRETVSFHDAWERFDADGRLRAPERSTEALHRLLDELAWWGDALRVAREEPADAALSPG
jgi:NAD(P)H-dependent FMN reductase